MNQLELFEEVDDISYVAYKIQNRMEYYFKYVNPEGDFFDYITWKNQLEGLYDTGKT